MSKQGLENPSDAPETTAGSQSGATNIKENSMSPSDLLKINVNEHTEKKNGLTYLSWAWAWAKVLEVDPQANYEVEQFSHPNNSNVIVPFQSIGNSCLVWVSVTIFGKTVKVQLPVLDYRNKCILEPNAFDINTSIMRCLTKGIAMHGLSLYIYAGEDLPMDAEPEAKPKPVTIKPVDADTGKVKADVDMDTGNADANAQLFADGMIQFSTLVKDVKDLNSYWKANQGQLDKLKASHPDLYEKVRNTFANLKAQFSTKE
jgi:hypothetical protein